MRSHLLKLLFLSSLFLFLPLILNSSSYKEVIAQSEVANVFIFPLDVNRYRISGFGFNQPNGSVFHPGEDWNRIVQQDCNDDRGDPVFAIANGEVVAARNFYGSFGNIVLIKHTLTDGSNIWSQYAHLERIDVTLGPVKLGKQIGTIGSGATSCAHLHFEIRISDLSADHWSNLNNETYVYNNYINPSNFLSAIEIDSGAILFEDTFFRGGSFPIPSATSVNVTSSINDRASSIALPRCWGIRVFKDANLQGSSRTFHNSDLSLSETYDDGTSVNDSISSINVFVNVCSGDANHDGRVDGIDYMIWRNNYLKPNLLGPSYGDFNSDGKIDGIDYMIWRQNYGK